MRAGRRVLSSAACRSAAWLWARARRRWRLLCCRLGPFLCLRSSCLFGCLSSRWCCRCACALCACCPGPALMGRLRLLDPRVGCQVWCVCFDLLACWPPGRGGRAACFGPLRPAAWWPVLLLACGFVGGQPCLLWDCPAQLWWACSFPAACGRWWCGCPVAVLCLVGLATGLPGLLLCAGVLVFPVVTHGSVWRCRVVVVPACVRLLWWARLSLRSCAV